MAMILSTPSQMHWRAPAARGVGKTAGSAGVPVPIVAGGGWEAGRSGTDAAFSVLAADVKKPKMRRQRISTK